MVTVNLHKDYPEIWSILEQVPDPEIPVINLVELGVIRDVKKEGNKLIVTITPTYTGCPAKKLFEDLIIEELKKNGFDEVEIINQLSPAWTTDWLSQETRQKMMDEGISPPTDNDAIIKCPNCGSNNTKMVSRYGSTPCQSFHSCNDCLEPFNYFKCHR